MEDATAHVSAFGELVEALGRAQDAPNTAAAATVVAGASDADADAALPNGKGQGHDNGSAAVAPAASTEGDIVVHVKQGVELCFGCLQPTVLLPMAGVQLASGPARLGLVLERFVPVYGKAGPIEGHVGIRPGMLLVAAGGVGMEQLLFDQACRVCGRRTLATCVGAALALQRRVGG